MPNTAISWNMNGKMANSVISSAVIAWLKDQLDPSTKVITPQDSDYPESIKRWADSAVKPAVS